MNERKTEIDYYCYSDCFPGKEIPLPTANVCTYLTPEAACTVNSFYQQQDYFKAEQEAIMLAGLITGTT